MSLIRKVTSASNKNKGKQICDDELAGSDKQEGYTIRQLSCNP
jgi:hypothetical protein